MTLTDAIHAIAGEPEAPLSAAQAEVLREALARYPYFALPAALLLRAGAVAEADVEALRARVAVLTADKGALATLASKPEADPARFYPPEPVAAPVSTNNAIDTFLDTYGNTSPEEEALLERLIFNPVPDYADVLAAECEPTDAPADAQDALIDAFLKKEAAEPVPEPTLPEAAAAPAPVAEDASLSESLARIFIGQGRFESALEIIEGLAAKDGANPFYADQVRYLRKLVRLKGAIG